MIERYALPIPGFEAISGESPRIEADRGWFLENGYLLPAKSKAIRAEVTALCDALAGEAVALVDAFAIPDAAISAPIAMR